MSTSLVSSALVRVSSVLNRDQKNYGKQCLFDGKEDTCWNSDQGAPQWVSFNFKTPVIASDIRIQFQGGFAGQECWLEADLSDSPDLIRLLTFYPEDTNSLQEFHIPEHKHRSKSMRLMFGSSTDLYGRVIIYRLDLFGSIKAT